MFKRLLVLLGLGSMYRGWNRRRRFGGRTPYYGAGAGSALLTLLAWLGWKNRDRIRSRLASAGAWKGYGADATPPNP